MMVHLFEDCIHYTHINLHVCAQECLPQSYTHVVEWTDLEKRRVKEL